jgi:hypothetical protein
VTTTSRGPRLLAHLGAGGRRGELAEIVLDAVDARGRALNALADLRNGTFAMPEFAEAAHGVEPETLRRLDVVDRRGRPTPTDDLATVIRVVGPDGGQFTVVRGSEDRKDNAAHARALQHFLATGDASVLEPFRGRRIGDVDLLVDPDLIEVFDEARRLEGGPYPQARSL